MTTSQSEPSSSEKRSPVWVLLSGAMALTFAIMLFLPNSGAGEGMLSVYAIMLWFGIFAANLFHYLGRNGWIGFAVGSVAGIVIQILSQFS